MDNLNITGMDIARTGADATSQRTIYPIKPIAKPRMTRRDKWMKRPCVLAYRAFKDECRLRRVTVEPGDSIIFVLPMPESWSKKKKSQMDGKFHTQKPDLDNMLKALFDAVLDEDSHMHSCQSSKVWGRSGSIVIDRVHHQSREKG